MSDLIETAVQRVFVETRTATVGQVTAFRRATGGKPEYCKIQPGLRRTLQDGSRLDMPEVDNVPILWPGGNGFTSGCDLVVGDEVLCVVSDRAVDIWIQSGRIQTPSHGRMHDITDIVVLPGLLSYGNAATVQRGANTWYVGDKGGQPPWVRLDRGLAKSATIEGVTINLGQQAALGVARMTDKGTVLDAAWIAWLTAVGAATFVGVPPFPQPIAQITTASTKVKAE
jgi:hypothetical protein